MLALLGTTSRSAFLVLAIMSVVWWIRSKHKLKYALLGMIVGFAVFVTLPEERVQGLTDKYKTSSEYDTDTSFQSRVKIWTYVLENLADKNPFVGGGFESIVAETTRYAHNSYFEVLGEHGYVGLVIFVTLGIIALMRTNAIFIATKNIPSLSWARDLSLMLQLSLLGYFLGGVTKNHGFFEMYYMQLAMVSLVQIVEVELSEQDKILRKSGENRS